MAILAFLIGALLVSVTLISAIRTFVVPRGIQDRLTAAVFRVMRRVFDLWAYRLDSYAARDRVMAFFAPISLLTLPAVWLTLILTGYTAMFWALGVRPLEEAIRTSGSSLLTLGFAPVGGIVETLLAFSEAAIGLTLLALLIAYLPTMYAAFARRETEVTLLETAAGSPPSPVVVLTRAWVIGELDRLTDLWMRWQVWFADISESHTSLTPLIFYRSPTPDRSWVTAAGVILDAASLASSTLDRPRNPEAELMIRSGYLALRHIAEVLGVPFHADPHFPQQGISVSRAEFDAAYDRLADAGIPLKTDREACWFAFAGWRVNYDDVLLAMAGLTMAPPAPWSSDRAPEWRLPILRRGGRSALAIRRRSER